MLEHFIFGKFEHLNLNSNISKVKSKILTLYKGLTQMDSENFYT